MAKDEIRDGIREALEPVGGTIQDIAVERRQWLSTLVPGRSVMMINFFNAGAVTGTYVSHDDKVIVISNSTQTTTVDFMDIDDIDLLS